MKVFLFLVCSVVSFALNAQVFSVPETYSLIAPEDYAPLKEEALQTIGWMLKTPMELEQEKRDLANAFVMTWLAGTPDYTFEIESDRIPFIEAYPDLFFVFMAGFSKAKMLGKNDPREHYRAGYKAVSDMVGISEGYAKCDALKTLKKAKRRDFEKLLHGAEVWE